MYLRGYIYNQRGDQSNKINLISEMDVLSMCTDCIKMFAISILAVLKKQFLIF
jgi:hypothetical protein